MLDILAQEQQIQVVYKQFPIHWHLTYTFSVQVMMNVVVEIDFNGDNHNLLFLYQWVLMVTLFQESFDTLKALCIFDVTTTTINVSF